MISPGLHVGAVLHPLDWVPVNNGGRRLQAVLPVVDTFSMNSRESSKWFRRRKWFAAITRRLAVVISMVLILAFIIVTPYAFQSIGGTDRHWVRLANIGQTYGAISALLSGLALLGVVLSLRHQGAQRLSDSLLAKQQRHHDMMRYVFDNPEYSQCWGPKFAPNGVDERLYFYVNIILGEWQASYQLGELSRLDIRLYAAIMFKSELPRMFWEQHGYLRSATSRRMPFGDFALIISEEYDKAVELGPPERPYSEPGVRGLSRVTSGLRWRDFAAWGLGVAAVVAVARAARKLPRC